jgi:hypothetical protein
MIKCYFGKIHIIKNDHLSKNQNWNFISEKMEIFNNKKGINCYEWLDREIQEKKIRNKWMGFLHNTISYPEEYPEKYQYQVLPINHLVNNRYFLRKIKNCLKIIVFTDEIKKFLIKQTGFKDVESITHPAPDYLFERKWSGNTQRVLHIGQQLRKYHSFLDLETKKNKIMLSPIMCENDILEMKKYSNKIVNLHHNLELKQYLNLLCESIVFLDLYDVAACNTIIECIVLNVPILVKKLKGCVEYLGEDYPYYFENLEEASEKINDNNLIHKTNQYLINLNKEKFKLKYFLEDFYTKVLKNINQKISE